MRTHPIDLSEYGKRSDGGGDVFRVIMAEDRTDTLICEGRTYQVPRYQNVSGWVLEKWIDAETYFGGMDRKDYESHADALAVKSEYFSTGDYESSRILGSSVDPVVVRDWIERVVFQRNHLSQEDRRLALTEKAETEELAKQQIVDNTIDTLLKG